MNRNKKDMKREKVVGDFAILYFFYCRDVFLFLLRKKKIVEKLISSIFWASGKIPRLREEPDAIACSAANLIGDSLGCKTRRLG